MAAIDMSVLVRFAFRVTLTFALFSAGTAAAAVLPEDKTDVLYHAYSGDGLEVHGPSVLVRKGYKDKVSVWANYYVDMLTSASVDVEATASEYTEERVERSAGVDYLHGKTSIGFSWTNSEEDDYSAHSYRLGVSHDFFGDLTTVGISYARGDDVVRRNGDAVFEEEAGRQVYRVDLTQILTKSLIVNVNYEGVTDEGFLNNPYRQVRYLDPNAARGFSYESELYPNTRTSSAAAVRAMYFLPYRASLKGEFRGYSDSWGISAWNAEVAYVHPFANGLTFDLKYRYYTQDAADFYSDLFPRQQAQNFLARDKELSTFETHTIGAGISYEFETPWLPFFTKGEANLFMDFITFQYADFRNVNIAGDGVGTEPFHSFDAQVLRAYFSFWY
ncbi:MAG: DUF3570 domain-containing protein [Pseudomonadota bacterium]